MLRFVVPFVARSCPTMHKSMLDDITFEKKQSIWRRYRWLIIFIFLVAALLSISEHFPSYSLFPKSEKETFPIFEAVANTTSQANHTIVEEAPVPAKEKPELIDPNDTALFVAPKKADVNGTIDGEVLAQGEKIKSPNGQCTLEMTDDGDLLVHRVTIKKDRPLTWWASTGAHGGGRLHLTITAEGELRLFNVRKTKEKDDLTDQVWTMNKLDQCSRPQDMQEFSTIRSPAGQPALMLDNSGRVAVWTSTGSLRCVLARNLPEDLYAAPIYENVGLDVQHKAPHDDVYEPFFDSSVYNLRQLRAMLERDLIAQKETFASTYSQLGFIYNAVIIIPTSKDQIEYVTKFLRCVKGCWRCVVIQQLIASQIDGPALRGLRPLEN